MTAHETTPSDAAIGQAFRETLPDGHQSAVYAVRISQRASEIEQGRGARPDLPERFGFYVGARLDEFGLIVMELMVEVDDPNPNLLPKDKIDLYTAEQMTAYGEACRRMVTTNLELSACECGNDFIEIFGDDISGWWVGCKSCSRVGRHNHSNHETRENAVSHWNSRMGNRDE